MAFGAAAALTFATKLATFVITGVTAIVLARWLGPAGRGAYAVLTLIPTAIVTAVNLGLPTAATIAIGRDASLAPRALGGAVAFSGAAVAIGWVATLAAWPLWSNAVPDSPPFDIALVLFVALPLLLYAQLIAILQGLRDFRTTSTLILLSYILVLALQLALVVGLGLGLEGAILAFAGAHLGIAVLALVVVRARVGTAAVDLRLLRRDLGAGLPTYLGALTWLVLSRAALLTCAVLLPAEDVGRFAVALTFVEVLLYAADSVVFALTPHAAAASDAHYSLTPLATRAVVVAAGIGALGLFVGARALVVVLFGAEFEEAAVAVRWLLPGIVAASVARVLAADLVARDHAWSGLLTLLAGAAVAVISAPPLIAIGGISGGAAASSLAHAVAAAAAIIAYGRTTGVPPAALVIARRSDLAVVATVLQRSRVARDPRLTPE